MHSTSPLYVVCIWQGMRSQVVVNFAHLRGSYVLRRLLLLVSLRSVPMFRGMHTNEGRRKQKTKAPAFSSVMHKTNTRMKKHIKQDMPPERIESDVSMCLNPKNMLLYFFILSDSTHLL